MTKIDKDYETLKRINLESEIQTFGCSKASLMRMVKEQAFPGTELMFAAGILSDAQEIISAEFNEDGWVSPDQANQARQFLNRAKAIMFMMMESRKEPV